MRLTIQKDESLIPHAATILAGLHSYDNRATVLALSGDLGAGKTALTKAIGEVLGLTETVTSPTFTIERRYPLQKNEYGFIELIHIDAYRISEDMTGPFRLSDTLGTPHTLVVCEWPEQLGQALPHPDLSLHIHVEPDGVRTITSHAS